MVAAEAVMAKGTELVGRPESCARREQPRWASELVARLELLSPLRVKAQPGMDPIAEPVPDEVNRLISEVELALPRRHSEENDCDERDDYSE